MTINILFLYTADHPNNKKLVCITSSTAAVINAVSELIKRGICTYQGSSSPENGGFLFLTDVKSGYAINHLIETKIGNLQIEWYEDGEIITQNL